MQDVELNEELKDEADEALLEELFLWAEPEKAEIRAKAEVWAEV
jgi:hypothetical protein